MGRGNTALTMLTFHIINNNRNMPLHKFQISYLDVFVDRFLMKLFNANNVNTAKGLQSHF